MEDVHGVPPSVGAGLNTVVVFHFDGVPAGPFDQASLPVFTTPAEVTPEAGVPGTFGSLPAKGGYELMVDEPAGLFRVEFVPFLPIGTPQISYLAPPQTVPGLLPGSVYTAQVSTTPGSAIGNLNGAGGSVKFGTTSNPAAWFPVDPSDDQPPSVVLDDGQGGLVSMPADGSTDFFPGTFATQALDASTPTFPDGPSDVLLVYDKPLQPSSDNISGRDLDGDGIVESTFVFTAQGTELLLGHRVPASGVAGGGGHAAFDALSGYVAGQSGDVTGAEVILHNSLDGGLLGPSAGMAGPLKALASGRDAGLLFAVFGVVGGDDLLSVGDGLLGDPSGGVLGTDAPGGGQITLDTGLEDLVGLVQLASGRLLGFDRGTRRVVELSVSLVRQRPMPGKPELQGPVLLGLSTGVQLPGELFLSEPWPAGLTVYDLAQAPSGRLFALGTLAGSIFPSLVELPPVDPDLDGVFEPGEAVWSGSSSDVVLAFDGQVEALEFASEDTLVVLDRGADALLRAPLDGSASEVLVADVASFGQPLPGGLSPATTLAMGRVELDLAASLVANDTDGAAVALEPRGVLPIGAALELMQRNVLTSLSGVNELNADPARTLSPLGLKRVLGVMTAAPLAGVGSAVSDTFQEDFVDTLFESQTPGSIQPPAEWAATATGLGASGILRAFVGVGVTAQLGDFRPFPSPGYDETKAYLRGSQQKGEKSLVVSGTPHTLVLLDTDAQLFPLASGATPGLSAAKTVFGGHFAFHDFIIPAGVHVVVRGSNPLRITATGTVIIDGMLDLSGTDGFNDDTFDSGFLPVPGGAGGAGGGRGGDAHPTRFDPRGSGAIDQYVTPETGERGWGPVASSIGKVTLQQVGGHGGLSTAGYHPSANGTPRIPNNGNSEYHRPPGGGGGSFYAVGDQAHRGTGAFRVQSESSWFPFSECAGLIDSISSSVYGNNENIVQGQPNATPLQCVYLQGTPQDPERYQPGGLPGDAVFKDADPSNDYIGAGGELTVLLGGQGGGGGGTRIDSLRQATWAADAFGAPDNPPPLPPPAYPRLFTGIFLSPTLWDAKGGGGGGGGGSVQIRSFGDIVVTRLGHIEARGGHGGGGEVVQNSNYSGGGGGGSGGAIVLQAAGEIRLEADPGHRAASFVDSDGDQGASLEVSGGMGRDCITDARPQTNFSAFSFEVTRGDAGQGGMGMIQLQAGGGTGMPAIQEGAHAFAKKRTVLKLGKWTGDPQGQEGHDQWTGGGNNLPPDDLRMIELLHYRHFVQDGSQRDQYMILNGTHPPIIPSTTGDNGHELIHEYPAGSGQAWFDTKMIANELTGGRLVVQEPQPEKVMRSYLGWDPDTFKEPFWKQGPPPGELFEPTDEIPLSVALNEPDGTPIMVQENGVMIVDPTQMIDRLPLVHPATILAPLGSVSHGTSEWLDFNGVALRTRNQSGRSPPFFAGIHGTFNASAGVVIPAGQEGLVRTAAPVSPATVPAHYLVDAGLSDPGLFGGGVGSGTPPSPPKNDLKVDAQDAGIGLENVLTDNAEVSLVFQGAYAVRPGAHVPDELTLTPWVADVTELDGYPLVRFRVVFDLGADTAQFPFGVDSMRPSVDYVRLRATY